jgi:hypothetical protein
MIKLWYCIITKKKLKIIHIIFGNVDYLFYFCIVKLLKHKEMEWGILDGKTLVFIEWVGVALARISDGEESIIVAKTRLEI